MGNATTTANFINSTAFTATVVAQVIVPATPDRPLGPHQTEVLQPGQQRTMLLHRNQPGDVRANVIVSLSNGTSGSARINVKPEDCVLPIMITNTDIWLNDRSYGKIVPSTQPQPYPGPPMPGPPTPYPPPQPQYPQPPVYPPQPMPPQPMPYPPQPTYPPGPPPPYPYPPGQGPVYPPSPEHPQDVPPQMLPTGRRVHITARSTGKNLRLNSNGSIDANGHTMEPATWIIDPSLTGFLRLRNVAQSNYYLALRGGQLTWGEGGPFCEFRAYLVGKNVYCLRSAHEDLGVGFMPDGNPRNPVETKFGEFAQLFINPC